MLFKSFCMMAYEDPEVSIPLFGEENAGPGPRISIVIGPNGSSKSRVLSRVVDELHYLSFLRDPSTSSQKRLDPPAEFARTSYQLDGARCKVTRRGREVECTVDDRPTPFNEIPFPTRVVAVSHLPADKFRFGRGESSDFYRYLGLRQATNLTTTGALEAKVIQTLFNGLLLPGFDTRMSQWLALAGMDEDIRVAISVPDLKLLTGEYQVFVGAAADAAKRRYGRQRASSVLLNPQWFEDLDRMWPLFEELHKFNWQRHGRGAEATLQIMPRLLEIDNLEAWINGFEAARKWRIFNGLSLVLVKNGQAIEFSDLSSGEQQLIGTSIRLLAGLEPHTLVIIDEPEVSLHPEWQIKYVPTLMKTLEEEPSTHVVIATHSHFMVSDLKEQGSALITASGGRKPEFSIFDGEVYGRSPENILYRVFGVATAGNVNVESDLSVALRMMSGSLPMRREDLTKIYDRLRKVRGEDNIALNVILHQIGSVIEVGE